MPRKTPSCYERAVNFLARRGHAVKELAGKLKEKGYPGPEIAETIDKLLELGFLGDAAFAESRVRYRAEISKWGRTRILQELRQKGVAEDVANKAVEAWQAEQTEFESREKPFFESAENLLAKKYGGWPEDLPLEKTSGLEWEQAKELRTKIEKEKAKRMNFLLRRGFSVAEAQTALESLLAGHK